MRIEDFPHTVCTRRDIRRNRRDRSLARQAGSYPKRDIAPWRNLFQMALVNPSGERDRIGKLHGKAAALVRRPLNLNMNSAAGIDYRSTEAQLVRKTIDRGSESYALKNPGQPKVIPDTMPGFGRIGLKMI
jgi:hypothetical protein